jgi:hypothetical protein
MHMASQTGGAAYDETDEYDRKHGRTTCDDESKSSRLTETSNKPALAPISIKITTK